MARKIVIHYVEVPDSHERTPSGIVRVIAGLLEYDCAGNWTGCPGWVRLADEES
jgi:hypothetical protein